MDTSNTGSVNVVHEAPSNGLVAPGGSGSLSTPYEASVTGPDGGTTTGPSTGRATRPAKKS